MNSARDESFDDFVRREQAGLVRYAALLCGSPAQGEDLVQDVLIRIYQRWNRLADRPGDVLPYVRRAVTNAHISWRRRWSVRSISTGLPLDVDAQSGPEPDERPDAELWAQLMRLGPQQRAAVVLRYYEGLTDAEIAAALGCRPATVRVHISRGLAALRSSIDLTEVKR